MPNYKKPLFRYMKGSVKIYGDIFSTGEKWNAENQNHPETKKMIKDYINDKDKEKDTL